MKKCLTLIVAIALMLLCSAALADTEITVSGTGEVHISADTAVISLGVNARDKDALKAQQKANGIIAAIRAALQAEGVEEKEITTDFMNLYAIYDYQNDGEQVSAYNASSTLAIRVTDMERVGTLIDVSFGAGANTLNGITFSASDPGEAKTEAMKAAVADAQRKAEILAEAAGLQITGMESIAEGSVYSYENSVGNAYARAAGMDAEEDAGTVVQAAKLLVSATVTITFEAK